MGRVSDQNRGGNQSVNLQTKLTKHLKKQDKTPTSNNHRKQNIHLSRDQENYITKEKIKGKMVTNPYLSRKNNIK